MKAFVALVLHEDLRGSTIVLDPRTLSLTQGMQCKGRNGVWLETLRRALPQIVSQCHSSS